jgi:predicted outer membrane repeat protein
MADGYNSAIVVRGKHLVIRGNNATLDAAGSGGLFYAHNVEDCLATTLELYDLTLKNGLMVVPPYMEHGGAIFLNCGDKSCNCRMKIHHCNFENNTATMGGGAINFVANGGQLEIRDSTFKKNKAWWGNSGQNGGALCLSYCSALLSSVEFDGNRAGNGGAIYIGSQFDSSSPPSTLMIISSTFNGNTVDDSFQIAVSLLFRCALVVLSLRSLMTVLVAAWRGRLRRLPVHHHALQQQHLPTTNQQIHQRYCSISRRILSSPFQVPSGVQRGHCHCVLRELELDTASFLRVQSAPSVLLLPRRHRQVWYRAEWYG